MNDPMLEGKRRPLFLMIPPLINGIFKKNISTSHPQKLVIKEKRNSKKGAFYYMFDYSKYKKLEHEELKFIFLRQCGQNRLVFN